MKRFQGFILLTVLAFLAGFMARDQWSWLWDHVLIYVVAIPLAGVLIWLYARVTLGAADQSLKAVPDRRKDMVEAHSARDPFRNSIYDDDFEKFDQSVQ